MLYTYLFRSKWAALFWALWICVGVYFRTPRASGETAKPAQAEHVNPWAKDAK